MKIKTEKIKVYDMTCTSCERKVERILKKLNGVAIAKANHNEEQVIVEYDIELCDISKIKESIKSAGYSVESSNNYKVIGILIVAAAIIFLGSSTAGFDMNAKLNGASYTALFIIGMFTSIHCVGMCGGIMLSQSISKKDVNKLQAIRPAILYNAGRVIAYTLDLRAFDNLDEKFEIISSDTKESMTSADVVKGLITMEVKLDKAGKYAIVNSSNILTAIQCSRLYKYY